MTPAAALNVVYDLLHTKSTRVADCQYARANLGAFGGIEFIASGPLRIPVTRKRLEPELGKYVFSLKVSKRGPRPATILTLVLGYETDLFRKRAKITRRR